MNIFFSGASQLVTGSSYLLSIGDNQILIDFGMFQGLDEAKYNYNDIKFDPLKIDCVILTHAHLDHCGLLPMLIKKGYRGPIYSTIQTKQLSEIILLDSAKLQEINIQKNNNIMLYDTNDVLTTLSLFEEFNFFETIHINNNIDFQFLPVGHILGASSIYLNTPEGTILFSGDIGRTDQSIIKSFIDYDLSVYNPNYIIMECLYGGIEHESRDSNILHLIDIINDTNNNNGSTFIPIFSLHRAQELLNILKINQSKLSIQDNIHYYLDSPMAHKITNIYLNNSSIFNEHFLNSSSLNNKPNNDNTYFSFENLSIVKKSKKSQNISKKSNSVIIAGSGMADGGRIVNHLYNNLSSNLNSIVFVGFQAKGTLGNQLINNIKSVKINDKMIDVKAKIYYLKGFSAHADNNDLIKWINKYNLKDLKKIFLTHAEKDKIQNFSAYLNNINISNIAPKMYDKMYL